MVRWLAGLAVAGTILYPAIVYFGRDSVPSATYVAVILAVLGLRLAISNTGKDGPLIFPLVLAAVGIFILAVFDVEIAVRAYPALVAIGFGALFAYSLVWPPTLIERLARLKEPGLAPGGAAYCRRLTVVWAIFCVCNAAISAATAVWGSIEVWSLWTGLLSYIAIGILFFGEFALRSALRRGQV
jgi:uncharacterized membrane protein